jgi:hypothetical protein
MAIEPVGNTGKHEYPGGKHKMASEIRVIDDHENRYQKYTQTGEEIGKCH